MASNRANHPAVVWGVCFLWLWSMVMIIFATAAFFCVGDVLGMLQLDILLALYLLSGLLMSPSNVFMLYMISKGEQIKTDATVLCCPLWLSVASVIIINFTAACLCVYKICNCSTIVHNTLILGMKYYRRNPQYKHFMDTLQWAIKCCGLKSYTDWFSRDWYDKIRDYEWNPASDNRLPSKEEAFITDSVPLSCCKTGSCISNYLMEMGTASIHSKGCARQVYTIIMIALIIQLIMFASVVIVEVLILCCLAAKSKNEAKEGKGISPSEKHDVKHILNVNPCFESSGCFESSSEGSHPDDSDSQKKVAQEDVD